MPAPYVTGGAILTHVRKEGATGDEEDWADACAAAIEGVIDEFLDGGALTPTSSQEAELIVAALQDGAACYIGRTAPHGIMSISAEGDIVRLGRNLIRELDPILQRIQGGPGIG